MKKTKTDSYNSTPFSSSKENICPNTKFNTVAFPKKLSKNQLSPSLGTDSQFSVFNTINMNHQSNQNSIASKSRGDMQAILQNFSSKKSMKQNSFEYLNKTFLALLGLALGKQQVSVKQAIDRCEEYEITCKDQLISILQQKDITREWPLPLSNLLLTDLGHLKILQICEHLEEQQDLNESQLQIVQFLLPTHASIECLDKNTFLQFYNQFRNNIDQKFNQVDVLVKQYTLEIQPKIKDKVLLVKLQKRLRKYQKISDGRIPFGELRNCLDILPLNEQQILIICKYFYFLEHDKMISIVNRRETVDFRTCIRQLLDKHQNLMIKHTVSTLQVREEQNNSIINELLVDKSYLMQKMINQDHKIDNLNNCIALLQLQLQKKEKQFYQEKKRQIEAVKTKYQQIIHTLQEENEEKDYLVQWYKNQLEAVATQNAQQLILKNRNKIYQKTIRSQYLNDYQQND